MKQICTECKQEKSIQQFHIADKIRNYRSTKCRACLREIQRMNYKKRSPALIVLEKEYGVKNPSFNMIKQIERSLESKKNLRYFIEKVEKEEPVDIHVRNF